MKPKGSQPYIVFYVALVYAQCFLVDFFHILKKISVTHWQFAALLCELVYLYVCAEIRCTLRRQALSLGIERIFILFQNAIGGS